MVINTILSLHETVLKLIEGKIVPIMINEVKYRIVPLTEAEGGEIMYGGIRQDINTCSMRPNEEYSAIVVDFAESEVGRTIFRTKEEMISYLSGKDIEPSIARRSI